MEKGTVQWCALGIDSYHTHKLTAAVSICIKSVPDKSVQRHE